MQEDQNNAVDELKSIFEEGLSLKIQGIERCSFIFEKGLSLKIHG